ncbi:TraR/DksA family transcriptional regulator [Telmatospirillum sp. J64-1]|uniref:TraR/DksA family transcriptional regulator n=1 Tax=Telmatospirillum sp. J64-1 TaxID=2502183 RepID=UPI00115CC612|nr:TraR/DksA family transcriptional regulator [Telmatospirillum sp. J64-1]
MDTEHLKTRLEEQLQALDSLAESTAGSADPAELEQAQVDRLSRVEAMQDQAMAAETIRRRQVERQRILAALARIKEGEYGYCVACGEDIQPKRLELDPAVPTCIACAQKAG